MITPRHRISASLIPGAGRACFSEEAARPQRLIIAPDDMRKVYKWNDGRAPGHTGTLLPVAS
jgi:hypothetical protein